MIPKNRNDRNTAFSTSGLARKLTVKSKKIFTGTVRNASSSRLGGSVIADVRESRRDRIPKTNGRRNPFSAPGKKLMFAPLAPRVLRMPKTPTSVNATGKARSFIILVILRERFFQNQWKHDRDQFVPDFRRSVFRRRLAFDDHVEHQLRHF